MAIDRRTECAAIRAALLQKLTTVDAQKEELEDQVENRDTIREILQMHIEAIEEFMEGLPP